MSTKCQVGISCVSEGEIGDKVVKATVMRMSDEGNLLKKLFCSLTCLKRDLCDKGETETSLYCSSVQV
jgi:hypothetical protein